jgi:hypothetical protein
VTGSEDEEMKLLKTATIACVAAMLLFPAATHANRPDAPGIRAQIAKIYKPYSQELNQTSWWRYPVFSAETRKLIQRWRKLRENAEDEVDLGGADWLCACQDFDPKKFRVTVDSIRVLSSGQTEAGVTIHQGFGESSKQWYVMVNEKGRWEIDDIVPTKGKPGLKTELRSAIATLDKRK